MAEREYRPLRPAAVPASALKIKHDGHELYPVTVVEVEDTDDYADVLTGYVLPLPGAIPIDMCDGWKTGQPENIHLAVHYTGETKPCSSEAEAVAWLREKAQAAIDAGVFVNSYRRD